MHVTVLYISLNDKHLVLAVFANRQLCRFHNGHTYNESFNQQPVTGLGINARYIQTRNQDFLKVTLLDDFFSRLIIP